MFVVYAAADGHVEICGLCCHQRLGGCSWSVLLLEAMLTSMVSPEITWKTMIHAAAVCYRQGSFFCSGFYDFRLTVGE